MSNNEGLTQEEITKRQMDLLMMEDDLDNEVIENTKEQSPDTIEVKDNVKVETETNIEVNKQEVAPDLNSDINQELVINNDIKVESEAEIDSTIKINSEVKVIPETNIEETNIIIPKLEEKIDNTEKLELDNENNIDIKSPEIKIDEGDNKKTGEIEVPNLKPKNIVNTENNLTAEVVEKSEPINIKVGGSLNSNRSNLSKGNSNVNVVKDVKFDTNIEKINVIPEVNKNIDVHSENQTLDSNIPNIDYTSSIDAKVDPIADSKMELKVDTNLESQIKPIEFESNPDIQPAFNANIQPPNDPPNEIQIQTNEGSIEHETKHTLAAQISSEKVFEDRWKDVQVQSSQFKKNKNPSVSSINSLKLINNSNLFSQTSPIKNKFNEKLKLLSNSLNKNSYDKPFYNAEYQMPNKPSFSFKKEKEKQKENSRINEDDLDLNLYIENKINSLRGLVNRNSNFIKEQISAKKFIDGKQKFSLEKDEIDEKDEGYNSTDNINTNKTNSQKAGGNNRYETEEGREDRINDFLKTYDSRDDDRNNPEKSDNKVQDERDSRINLINKFNDPLSPKSDKTFDQLFDRFQVAKNKNRNLNNRANEFPEQEGYNINSNIKDDPMLKNEINHMNAYVERYKYKLSTYSKSIHSFDSLLASESIYVAKKNEEVNQVMSKLKKNHNFY